jgi:hypothetical protein
VKESATSQNKRKQTDVRAGIALAVSAFAISIFLYFRPQYFGNLSMGVAIALIFIGFAGLGTELNKMASGDLDALVDRRKGQGIFDNLGIGIALLVVWAALYHYFPKTWINVLASPVLLFGTYGTVLGLINALFFTVTRSSDEIVSTQSALNKPQRTAIRVISIFSGVLGFIASLIQILQFLRIVP